MTIAEAKARRLARKVGLLARKSRWQTATLDNAGHFMLVDPGANFVQAGFRYDMTAAEVIEYCETIAKKQAEA